MRLYSRAEFLKLPPGVLFFSGPPHAYGGLRVKGDTWLPNDWIELHLDSIDMGRDSGEMIDRYDAMLGAGASFPLNEDYGRNGGFDPAECFLVFEEEDLVRLIAHANLALVRALTARGR